MPYINHETEQVISKAVHHIITLSPDEVTKIVRDYLKKMGCNLIDGTVTPLAECKYVGNPDWGIPERPVGIFVGYRAEFVVLDREKDAQEEENHG